MAANMLVTVPKDVAAGGTLQITTPDGRPMNVIIPEGKVPGDTFEVAPPPAAVATAVLAAPAAPVAAAIPTGGVGTSDWLNGVGGLFVRQKLEILEMISGCETKNRYKIVTIPQGNPWPVESPNSTYTKPFRDQSEMGALLMAKEEGDCYRRICCPLFRDFTMQFTDSQQNNWFTIDRPFKCDPCHCPPFLMCNTQEMDMKDGAGQLLGHAEEVNANCMQCCSRTFKISDANGTEQYRLRASECKTKSGKCNCCAPTCCNEAYEVDVMGPNGELIPDASINFVWPGCNCGGLTDLSNVLIRFPENANSQERSQLLLGTMLIEFTVQEFKRQQNKNNNGGGGSGGAPPKGEEMER